MSDAGLREVRQELVGFAVVATSRLRGWHGFEAEVLGVSVAHQTTAPPRRHHVVSVCATGSRRVLQRRAGVEHVSPADVGDAFVMPAGLESTWDGNLPACIRLAISAEEIEKAAADLRLSKTPRIRNEFRVTDPALQRMAWWMNRGLTVADETRSLLEVSGIAALLASHLLVRYSTAEIKYVQPEAVSASHAIRRAITFIRDQLDTDLTLDQIAAEARISRFHLSRTFHNEVGISITGYLQQARIDRAKQLLHDDTLAIADIAKHVGYRQASQFIRVFREHTGSTPGTWRRTH